MTTRFETQVQKIKTYLEAGNSITSFEALQKFGSFRLSAVIFVLRQDMDIWTISVMENNKHFGRYVLSEFYNAEGHGENIIFRT